MFEKTKHHAANFDFCPINTFPGQMSHTLRLSFFSFSISSEQKLNLCVFKESKYTFSTSGSVGPSHSLHSAFLWICDQIVIDMSV